MNISYAGLDEAELILGLYRNQITPNTFPCLLKEDPGLTLQTVRDDLRDRVDGIIRIDYYRGRPLKVAIDTRTKEFDPFLYDRDAGEGVAARVVAALLSAKQSAG